MGMRVLLPQHRSPWSSWRGTPLSVQCTSRRLPEMDTSLMRHRLEFSFSCLIAWPV